MFFVQPKFTSGISHFRNINELPVDGRVEYRIANTVLSNDVVPTYICEMFHFTLKV